MLIKQWITERVKEDYVNFERLSQELLNRAKDIGIDISQGEIKIVLERLIRDGHVETCQYLAEDQIFSPTVYDNSNIYWYWFRLKSDK